MLRQHLISYVHLMRLHKPIGIYLLMWPTLWALWIAGAGHPDPHVVIIFLLETIIMRSAGCVMNDLADRKFDGHVARTRARPLVTGKVTPCAAGLLLLSLCALALLVALPLNNFTLQLAVIALALALLYPFSKRVTMWPQLVLGLAFAWSVPMAFAALTLQLPPIAYLMFASAVLWPLAYDTMYAIADREDDRKLGIGSTALLFGPHVLGMIASVQSVVLSLLLMLGILMQFKLIYYSCLIAAAATAIYQQWLLRARTAEHALRAFQNNNWFGALVFLGILLNYVK